MRNVDQIKTLKKELAEITTDRNRWQKLAQSKHEEVEQLKGERKKTNEGVFQIQQAADIVVTTCAVMFGAETETGYKLTLPRSMDGHNLQAFALKLRESDGDEMVLEVVENAKEISDK